MFSKMPEKVRENILKSLKKDIHQINHLSLWGFLVGMFFFISMLFFISFIDTEIIGNDHIIDDTSIQVFLLIVAFFITMYIINHIIKFLSEFLNDLYLSRFKFLTDIQAFEVSKIKVNFHEKKYDHIVLLLHGFTASTQEFDYLIPHLNNEKICYIAHTIVGFGGTKASLLSEVSRYDWFRDAIEHFDSLTQIADKVSVIGHSMGSVLATYIAERRKVHHLIFTGPGLFCNKEDLKYRKILTMPILSALYVKMIPYLPKPIRVGRLTCSDTLDAEQAKNIFQYLAVPMASLKQLFLAQNEVHPQNVNCNDLSIVYGKYEMSVDIGKLCETLDQNKVLYQLYQFDNSAHNVLEDFDREECCRLIVNILKA